MKDNLVANAVVPTITLKQLKLKNNYDDSRKHLGQYAEGFWFQDNVYRLPFLRQSYEGNYVSPTLNGK
jgi:hypothetical protein